MTGTQSILLKNSEDLLPGAGGYKVVLIRFSHLHRNCASRLCVLHGDVSYRFGTQDTSRNSSFFAYHHRGKSKLALITEDRFLEN